MKLSVLISTIDSGIYKVSDILLKKRSNVEYVISHQYTDPTFKPNPVELERKDVLISHIPGKGLSKSRNNAIEKATGDIALLADDDVRYKEGYFDAILNTFQEKDVDVACFKINTPEGDGDYKQYPPDSIRIDDLGVYSPSSIEISFLLNKIRTNEIEFDERFGLGAKFIGGEEEIFMSDCLSKNLNCSFFPIYIVSHSVDSSNKQLDEYEVSSIKKRAALSYKIDGVTEVVKIFIRPFKNFIFLLNKNVNPFSFFYYQFTSAIYVLLTDFFSKLKKP